MQAQDIVAVLAVVFLALATVRLVRDGWQLGFQCRAWLLVSGIFAAVSAFLWLKR